MQPDDTSSGRVEEVQTPSTNLDLVISEGAIDVVVNLAELPAKTPEPITSSSAVPLITGEVHSFRLAYPSLLTYTDAIFVCQGGDLSGLLTFDPESIEPAPSTACDEPIPSAIQHHFQRLKA